VNALYYGDNLEVLRDLDAGLVDLIYLDPPFNSNRSYNVLFKNKSGKDAQAQIEAFDDTWTWSQQTDDLYRELVMGGSVPAKVADALEAMRRLLGDNDVLAYLVMMTARLVQLHRVLKRGGSLYLHCDPTASHYLKVILDATFEPVNFRSEIIWKRTSAHSDTKQGRAQHGRVHDVILFYSKGDATTWNAIYTPYDHDYAASEYRHVNPEGRRYKEGDLTAAKPGGDTSYEWWVKRRHGSKSRWEADVDNEHLAPLEGWQYQAVTPYNRRYWAYSKSNMIEFAAQRRLIHRATGAPRLMLFADEMPGVGPQDLWTDVPPISAGASERLGYPTQKPLALLERIVSGSSNPGDIVLDPFCGCGTTIDAAQKLGRQWIGIDVTFLAVDLIDKRLRAAYGDDVAKSYVIHGIPRDLDGARALFAQNPFDFERWAVSLVSGQPNEKQVGDKGIDGVIRFPIDNAGDVGRALVSVKGGATVGPTAVRDLIGTVKSQRAEMGVLVCLTEPTRGVLDAVRHSGSYEHPVSGTSYPKTQVVTVAELLAGKGPKMPTTILPYIQAKARGGEQGTLI